MTRLGRIKPIKRNPTVKESIENLYGYIEERIGKEKISEPDEDRLYELIKEFELLHSRKSPTVFKDITVTKNTMTVKTVTDATLVIKESNCFKVIIVSSLLYHMGIIDINQHGVLLHKMLYLIRDVVDNSIRKTVAKSVLEIHNENYTIFMKKKICLAPKYKMQDLFILREHKI